jgi:indole-3-glycerol phosphate synthase
MNVLDRIFATKLEEIAQAKSAVPVEALKDLAARQPSLRFREALASSVHPVSLVAEVKKASPSQGVIRPSFDALMVARDYASVGVDCLSVLTDIQYFQGSPEYLKVVKREVGIPCLRKDFICDPYQVYESRAWGADCILLIAASLSVDQMAELAGLSKELGMDTLVEVHDEDDGEKVAGLRADLVGVNNRNLRDFATSISTTAALLPQLQCALPDALFVSESAIGAYRDVEAVMRAGARSVLIGTTFCASPDIPSKVREVMKW